MLKKRQCILYFQKNQFDIYKHDIHFDEKAFQSGMLKIQFPNDNEKLSVYLKNKIPFENITIDLSALEKEARHL